MEADGGGFGEGLFGGGVAVRDGRKARALREGDGGSVVFGGLVDGFDEGDGAAGFGGVDLGLGAGVEGVEEVLEVAEVLAVVDGGGVGGTGSAGCGGLGAVGGEDLGVFGSFGFEVPGGEGVVGEEDGAGGAAELDAGGVSGF